MFILLLALSADPPLEWRPPSDGDPRCLCLFRGDMQIGAYVFDDDLYHPLIPGTRTFGPCCSPPIPVPNRKNFGVNRSAISEKEKITLSGIECTSVDAIREITRNGVDIPNARGKYRIVIVGNPSMTSTAAKLINECLSEEEKQTTIVQAYPADHWYIKQAGYVPIGELSVFFLDPSGKELLPADSLENGVVEWVEATRVKRPDYRPLKPRDGLRLLEWLRSKAAAYSLVAVLLLAHLLRGLTRR